VLTPKKGTRFAKKFDAIDVWVDPKTNMPARIDTAQGDLVRTTDVPDRDAFARYPEQAADPEQVHSVFERFGLPLRVD